MRFPTMMASLALAAAAVANEPAPPVVTSSQPVLFTAMSRIEVDATGAVVAVAPSPGLPEAVNTALAENLRKVRFAPAQRDGEAVGGVTFARQEACAVPNGEAYRLAVRFLGNGPGALVQGRGPLAPRYPADAMRAGDSATVKLSYRVGVDGAVSIDKAELAKGRGRYGREFVQAARAWLDGRQAEPEQLGGQAVVTTVDMTIVFDAGDGQTFSGPNARQMAQRSTQERVALDREQRVASSDACATAARAGVPEPEQVAVNSPFRTLPAN